MERCIICRARLGAADACSRCGCDYAPARRAERAAQRLARRAVRALGEGRCNEAVGLIDRATSLANIPLARILSKMLVARAAPCETPFLETDETL